MLDRHLRPRVIEALGDRPVVTLVGPRQAGKSTLAHSLVATGHLTGYLTLDDAAVLAAANSDPVGFVNGLAHGTVIDEVQRAPDVALAIKAAVDRDRRPGRLLLTGSADVMVLPWLTDALVGRTETLTLLPLTQGEIDGSTERFADAIFDPAWGGDLAPDRPPTVGARLVRGGYPEPLTMSARRLGAWHASYVTTVVQRDLRDVSRIAGLSELPRLLSMLGARASSLLNVAELSRTSGLPQSTLKRYLGLLEAAFLVELLPAWTGDPGRRLAHAPKVHIVDSGLAAWLMGTDLARLESRRELLGALLESFVVQEVRRQLDWSSLDARRTHYRSHDGREVDLVLEDRAGRIVGIEVKAAMTLRTDDMRGLRALAERSADRFVRGVLLYLGADVVPFGRSMLAMPVSAIWRVPDQAIGGPF